MTPAERIWAEINENLRLWNLKHGRKPKPVEGRPEHVNAQDSTSGRDVKVVPRIERVA